MSRRRFLKQLAAASVFPSAIRDALAIMPLRRTGSLMEVEHIVILTQENRSFDHYFGTLAGVRGFGDPHPIPITGHRSVFAQTREGEKTLLPPFHLDTQQDFSLMRAAGTPHTWPDAQAAWDHGRMSAWTAAKRNHAMGYYTDADIPFQFALARAFTLCDHYHCATQTGTNTNRLFLWSGHNDPFGVAGGPSTDNSHSPFHPDPATDYTWTTYAERLEDAGVRWQVYQDMSDNFEDNSLAGFRPFRDAYYERPGHNRSLAARGVTTRDLDLLRQDVMNGQLPQVSWIVATEEGSEHPGPSSPAQGADYTARVLAALTANPDVWSRTVFLVNYDENDGYFDHMPPPAPPSLMPDSLAPAGASSVSTEGEYHHILNGSDPRYLHRPYGLGPRVPMFVISPWSRGGYVNSQVFDHSSVLRFIEARFGVKELLISPWRRAVCGDLTSCFDFTGRDAMPFSPPATDKGRLRANCYATPKPAAIPADAIAPVQATGARPARALPYDLQVNETVQGNVMTLRFENIGKAGALFHVYDRLAPDAVPRRYTVGAGATLEGTWNLDAQGRYDLWVLAPNGFHRHFTGAGLQGSVRAQHENGVLVLTLSNRRSEPVQLKLKALRHALPKAQTVELEPNTTKQLRIELAAQGHWYDIGLTHEASAYACRLAGHIETGADSISDPAMGGPALLTARWPD